MGGKQFFESFFFGTLIHLELVNNFMDFTTRELYRYLPVMAGRALKLCPEQVMTISSWRLFHCPEISVQQVHVVLIHSIRREDRNALTHTPSRSRNFLAFRGYNKQKGCHNYTNFIKRKRNLDTEGSK